MIPPVASHATGYGPVPLHPEVAIVMVIPLASGSASAAEAPEWEMMAARWGAGAVVQVPVASSVRPARGRLGWALC